MSKLTKEEVISQLEAALSKQSGTTVAIEQKGSWYKIDGGKSVRFSELESQLAELTGGDVVASKAAENTETAEASTKVEKASLAKKPAKSSANTTGKTPKQLWREKLAGKGQLPQGF